MTLTYTDYPNEDCFVSGGSNDPDKYNMSAVYRGLLAFGCAFSAAHILVALSHCCKHCKPCAKFLTCILHICTFPFIIAGTVAYFGKNWGQECLGNDQVDRIATFT